MVLVKVSNLVVKKDVFCQVLFDFNGLVTNRVELTFVVVPPGLVEKTQTLDVKSDSDEKENTTLDCEKNWTERQELISLPNRVNIIIAQPRVGTGCQALMSCCLNAKLKL